ncbi:MAG: hypothetical protein MW689_001549 [Thermodesulfobacteria bacterium]|nr:hypothetical protein [Thermodesulfobacteriota bacterium]MCU4137978.1 hypothetical protein [Thermodesulfobacteriota bacterium]
MSSILGKHPLVYSFKELHFFERLYDPNSKITLDKNFILDLLMELLSTAKEWNMV